MVLYSFAPLIPFTNIPEVLNYSHFVTLHMQVYIIVLSHPACDLLVLESSQGEPQSLRPQLT